MIRDYLAFSLNNLRKRKMRSYLTMIGIFIGIASLVALIGLGEGLRTAISSQFGSIGTDKLMIQASGGFGPPGTGVISPLKKGYIKDIEGIKGAKYVIGRNIQQAKVEFNNKVDFTMVGSMPDGEGRKVVEEALNFRAEKGRMLKDGDKYYVVVGSNFADKTRFGKEIIPGSTIKVQDKDFRVVGIPKKTGSFTTDAIVVMNEDVMKDLFSTGDNYDAIVVVVQPNADIKQVKEDIEKILRKKRNVKEGEEDFTVQTPQAVLSQANSILTGIQIFVYIIASISLIVGGIGITNTMYTAVLERTKEIGIMKSIGARNSAIFTLFSMESGLLGSLGGLIGVIIGTAGANMLSAIGRMVLGTDLIRANISIYLIVGALFFSFIVGLVSGLLPAYDAAKMRPVDALRHVK